MGNHAQMRRILGSVTKEIEAQVLQIEEREPQEEKKEQHYEYKIEMQKIFDQFHHDVDQI